MEKGDVLPCYRGQQLLVVTSSPAPHILNFRFFFHLGFKIRNRIRRNVLIQLSHIALVTLLPTKEAQPATTLDVWIRIGSEPTRVSVLSAGHQLLAGSPLFLRGVSLIDPGRRWGGNDLRFGERLCPSGPVAMTVCSSRNSLRCSQLRMFTTALKTKW